MSWELWSSFCDLRHTSLLDTSELKTMSSSSIRSCKQMDSTRGQIVIPGISINWLIDSTLVSANLRMCEIANLELSHL